MGEIISPFYGEKGGGKMPKTIVRKVTPTGSGGELVNLGGIIPDNWEYVEVVTKRRSKDTITVELSVLREVDKRVKVSEAIPNSS